MTSSFVTVAAFCAAALAAAGLFSLLSDLFLRQRVRLSQRLIEELNDGAKDTGPKSQVFRDLGQIAKQLGPARSSLRSRIDTILEQSGPRVTFQQLAVCSLVVALATGAGLYLTLRIAWIAAVAGVLVSPVPLAVVTCIRNRRIKKLCYQLPEAFEMMTRCVRAGQTISGAMQIAGQDLEPPLAKEFARCSEQQGLGLPFDVALRDLAGRSGVIELQMFVVTFLVQRQTGGNPVEVLDNLAEVVRKRIKMQAKVKAATGEGRMQAVVLLVLPLVMFGAILLANFSYAKVLLERPMLLGGVLAWQAIGAAWIRKIISFDY